MFESLRLFMLLDATHWSHLPVAGGWYDQHPDFVDEVVEIFAIKAQVEREKEANRPHENRAGGPAIGNL